MGIIKSGIIYENKIMLTPIYNDWDVSFRDKLNERVFDEKGKMTCVIAHLTQPDNEKSINVKNWKYSISFSRYPSEYPDWYRENENRYEMKFRSAVEKLLKESFVAICGEPCIPIKSEADKTYYLLARELMESVFGNDGNYAESIIREKLNNCEFAKKLKSEYRNQVLPITLDLTSFDGFKDYGIIEGDILSLLPFDLFRECREKISCIDKEWWLATSKSTPSGYSLNKPLAIEDVGNVKFYETSDACKGVRPFFILKS